MSFTSGSSARTPSTIGSTHRRYEDKVDGNQGDQNQRGTIGTGFTFRESGPGPLFYLPGTASFIGTKDGNLSILLPGGAVTVVGRTADFLPQAINSGF